MRLYRGGLWSLLLFFTMACSTVEPAPAALDLPPPAPSPTDGGDGGGGGDPAAALFDPARLIEVAIRLAPADWEVLRLQTRTVGDVFTNCQSGPYTDPFTYFRGAVTIDGKVVADVGVRKKGFLGSLDENRPSLRLKFDEYVPGQRLAGLKSFTLNNARQDPSLVHQCLAYQTFAAAGVPAPRCNFARVTVNGADLGVYVHVESFGKELVARHYADDGGNLYEGTFSDFRPGWTATFELKTNEKKNDRSDLEPLVAALQAPDGELLLRLAPLLDVDRFLTFWAVESLIGHWDGYSGNTNNFYAYHDPKTGRFEFLPWGTDATFANRARPSGPLSVQATGLLTRRLYLLPETRDRYLARLRQLLGSVWDEAALGAEAERMLALLKPVADPDGRRGLAAQVAQVRGFINGRRAQIEGELAAGAPAWNSPLRGALCWMTIGKLAGSLQTTWGTVGAQSPLGTGSGTLMGTLMGADFAATQAGAVAGPFPMGGPGRVQLAEVALLGDKTLRMVVFSLASSRYRADVTWPIDMNNLSGWLYRFNQATMRFEPEGTLATGTLRLEQAGSTQGAKVAASFSATLIENRSP